MLFGHVDLSAISSYKPAVVLTIATISDENAELESRFVSLFTLERGHRRLAIFLGLR